MFFPSLCWAKIQNSINSMLQYEIFSLSKHICLRQAYILSEYGI